MIACPIGADVAGFESLARRPGVLLRAHRLRREVGAKRFILGVDRLDYTKGIPERLEAYARLLEIYPEWRWKYAPGVTHNVEHVFGLAVPAPLPVTLAPAEHSRFAWLPWREAASKAFSWTNVNAIKELEKRMHQK